MRTFIAYPPVSRPTGGTAVLLDIAACLARAGHPVFLVCRDKVPHLANPLPDHLRLLDWEHAVPTPQDLWLSPEGWPALVLPGLRHKARTCLYVQNWAYLLSSLPQGTHFTQLPLRLIAVSQPVAWHAGQFAGLVPEILRPGIDVSVFHPAPEWQPGTPHPAGKPVRVAWMPRKNKALALQIQHMVEARLLLDDAPEGVEWVAIHNNTRQEVAEILRSCQVFLSTGFPEGCPLPPLEAMASGCVVTGFGGFGGWDYMKQAMPEGWTPWWPQRPQHEKPWRPNGYFVHDADTVAAACALERAIQLVRAGGEPLEHIQLGALATARAYSLEVQEDAVRELWKRAASGVALV